ncbi:YkgJ family cysteine cluster protein [Sphingomonas sp. UYP23]
MTRDAIHLSAARDDEARRSGCTGCGACCNRGPKMELGETAALASTSIMSVPFKVHSIPLDERSLRARDWWREQGSRIPVRATFEEKRRHLSLFASGRRSERRNQREVSLTTSAMVDDYTTGLCPALEDGRCGICEYRPVTCRTVPLHYSRQPSILQAISTHSSLRRVIAAKRTTAKSSSWGTISYRISCAPSVIEHLNCETGPPMERLYAEAHG